MGFIQSEPRQGKTAGENLGRQHAHNTSPHENTSQHRPARAFRQTLQAPQVGSLRALLHRHCCNRDGCARRRAPTADGSAPAALVGRLRQPLAVVKQAGGLGRSGVVIGQALRRIPSVGASAGQRTQRLRPCQCLVRPPQNVVHRRVLQILFRQLCGQGGGSMADESEVARGGRKEPWWRRVAGRLTPSSPAQAHHVPASA